MLEMAKHDNGDHWFNKWDNNIWTNEFIARVTNKCNEQCTHCCFRSGPECVGQLSVADGALLNSWLPSYVKINIMGGEFTILPNYPEILIALTFGRTKAAIITNGQWAYDEPATQKFLSSIDAVCDVCDEVLVAISDDHWHQRFNKRAQRLYREHNPKAKLISGVDIPDDKILPLGRAWDNKLASRSFEACCGCCRETGQLTVIETGMITLCPMGYFPWKPFNEVTYNTAREYVWGWRARQLDLGMDCFSCMKQDQNNRLM